jgi:hypothetical protein
VGDSDRPTYYSGTGGRGWAAAAAGATVTPETVGAMAKVGVNSREALLMMVTDESVVAVGSAVCKEIVPADD